MSFGQDPRWRRAMVDAVAPGPGQRVLDVATGTGMVAFELVRRGCRVVGLDQSEQMLSGARAKLAAAPALQGQMEFMLGQAERLPFTDGEFDALTFTYLLRYVDDVAATMDELARVVRPGGEDRDGRVRRALAPPAALAVEVQTRVGLPTIGPPSLLRDWLEVGRFLGPNIEEFHAREPDLPGRWRAAGLEQVQARSMSFGAGLVMSGVRGGA